MNAVSLPRKHRGDTDATTGMVFWGYWSDKKRNMPEREVWLPVATFLERRARLLAVKRKYRSANNDRLNLLSKNWALNNRERVRSNRRKWMNQEENRRASNARSLAWKKAHPDRFREASRKRRTLKYKTDLLFRLKKACRFRISAYLSKRGWNKTFSTFSAIGCSPEFLRAYLEARFLPGMAWSNRTEWEIDHVIPLASAKTKREMLRLCHYTNLQPLWRVDNRMKSDNIPQQLSLPV